MEEVVSIMKNVLEPPVPAIAATPGVETRARPKSAKLAFRETLLGVSVPDLLQNR
jgi:hypothetical protein